MRKGRDTVDAAAKPPRRRMWEKRDAALVAVVLIGLATIVLLARFIEAHPAPDLSARFETEELYVTPGAARRMSLGFNAVVADWYWLRTLQYVGRRLVKHQGADINIDDLGSLRIKQLAPLLERAMTLDPQFIAVYEYGAMVLPAVDAEAAFRVLRKGIEANPAAWRLHHYLGYIHWQRGQFQEASEAYAAGADVQGAPSWMRVMAAQMQVSGGSRAVARDIYERMYAEADDEQVKTTALKRLLQIDSLDERDAIRRVLGDHRARTGNCARQWREVAPLLRAARLRVDDAGVPLDPTGIPYALDSATCEVKLGEQSEIPRR
ncbi:MAG TPA: hypothetical protein VM943_13045 [Pyrinomonadaceae bacterium]|nr:hypothetical protein [Pyrinomonadaceae bacterium]